MKKQKEAKEDLGPLGLIKVNRKFDSNRRVVRCQKDNYSWEFRQPIHTNAYIMAIRNKGRKAFDCGYPEPDGTLFYSPRNKDDNYE